MPLMPITVCENVWNNTLIFQSRDMDMTLAGQERAAI